MNLNVVTLIVNIVEVFSFSVINVGIQITKNVRLKMNELCKLDNLPPELKKVIIKKLRWYKEPIHEHSEGIDFICPYNASHRTYHKYSEYFGIEIVYCGACGYRYVGAKQDGVYKLINCPEVKHKQLVIRRR